MKRPRDGANFGRRRFTTLLALFLACSLLFPFARRSGAANNDQAIGEILSAAESLFKAMKARDGRAVWSLISSHSREAIAAETFKALSGGGTGDDRGRKPASRDEVAADFAAGGPISKSYWAGFMRTFDPDSVLEQSRWEIGTQDAERAVVVITHKDAARPAVVRMFREEGRWKVGLVETFWTR